MPVPKYTDERVRGLADRQDESRDAQVQGRIRTVHARQHQLSILRRRQADRVSARPGTGSAPSTQTCQAGAATHRRSRPALSDAGGLRERRRVHRELPRQARERHLERARRPGRSRRGAGSATRTSRTSSDLPGAHTVRTRGERSPGGDAVCPRLPGTTDRTAWSTLRTTVPLRRRDELGRGGLRPRDSCDLYLSTPSTVGVRGRPPSPSHRSRPTRSEVGSADGTPTPTNPVPYLRARDQRGDLCEHDRAPAHRRPSRPAPAGGCSTTPRARFGLRRAGSSPDHPGGDSKTATSSSTGTTTPEPCGPSTS